MKNITLSIEDNVLREARKYAAERETTVNALVRDYLTRLAHQKLEGEKVRIELARLSDQSEARLGSDWKWDREALYDRPVFSRHEHTDLRSSGSRSSRAKKKAGT
jgi:hypothetical protein